MKNSYVRLWRAIQLIALVAAIIALASPGSVIGELCSNALVLVWVALALSTLVQVRAGVRFLNRLSFVVLAGVLVTGYLRLVANAPNFKGAEIPLRALILQLHHNNPAVLNVVQQVSPNLIVIFPDVGVSVDASILDLPGYSVVKVDPSDASDPVSPVLLTKIPIIESQTDLGLDSSPAIVVRLAPGDESVFAVVAFNAQEPWSADNFATNRLQQRRSMLQVRHGQQPVLVFAALHANALTTRLASLQEAGRVSLVHFAPEIWQMLNPSAGLSSHVAVFARGFSSLREAPAKIANQDSAGYSARVVTNVVTGGSPH